jgi:hypothetical protein
MLIRDMAGRSFLWWVAMKRYGIEVAKEALSLKP